jgi:ribose/xylose/arabinose/galactoside ABC-type transport system permease subunit
MTALIGVRDRGADRARLIDFFAEYGFVVFFVIWVIYLSIATDTFLTERNLLLLLRQASIYGIPAIGATFVILLGELDISFGSVIGLAGVAGAEVLVGGGSGERSRRHQRRSGRRRDQQLLVTVLRIHRWSPRWACSASCSGSASSTPAGRPSMARRSIRYRPGASPDPGPRRHPLRGL